ncbi:MAG: HDIG domain-containing protein, partial [Bdellovibrionales bacterium]|nr:HDIG domain-containing protein [Bdellovibrionales bacterium]
LRAFEAISPVVISMKRNQILIPEGAEITARHTKMFHVLDEAKARDNGWLRHLSRAGVMMVLIIMFLSFMDLFARRSSRNNEHALSTMAVVTVAMVIIGKLLSHFLQRGLTESIAGQIPDVAFQYLLPLAAGPMIVGLLIPSLELSWFFSIFNSVIFGLLVGGDLSFLVVALTGSFVASRGVARVRRRNDIYKAGLRASIVAMLMGALITASQDQDSVRLQELLVWNGLLAFGGGMISSILALSFAPLLESIFGHTTDIRLLELSQLDHPLFKELIMKAPGTYHHCLVVGQLAESAAEAVGANPLLSRVASYYHDVGKSDHPNYFIENHRSGSPSPHDEISPYLSRTIIHAHVKDGVTKAREYRLGKPILDIIEQHHGTTLLNFFYKKARERALKDGLPEPSEQDFRYPGPKPQFRESAIVMLADSVEAASRSMDDPTPVQLTNLVKSIVQRKFADGQLSECHLTMKDLHLIEASLIKGILGVYHHRFQADSEEALASNGR